MRARLLGIVAFALAVLVSTNAHAVDPFEIQVYDGELNPIGVPGLELHTNYVANGTRDFAPPELDPNHQLHLTLEPSLGVASFCEIGGYLQSTVRPDGTFDFAGAKLRSKFAWSTHPSETSELRAGFNMEISLLPIRYDANRWGGEIRPIAAFENESWYLAFNPILSFSLAGTGWSDGPVFEPAIAIVKKVQTHVGVGIEYYASFGPIKSPSQFSQTEQYLYEVFDLFEVKNVEVNVGVGEGFTEASNPLIFKMILGYTFDK